MGKSVVIFASVEGEHGKNPQIELCRSYAIENNLQVARVYEFSTNSLTLLKERFDDILDNAVNQGISGILVQDMNCISKNSAFVASITEMFEKVDKFIISIK